MATDCSPISSSNILLGVTLFKQLFFVEEKSLESFLIKWRRFIKAFFWILQSWHGFAVWFPRLAQKRLSFRLRSQITMQLCNERIVKHHHSSYNGILERLVISSFKERLWWVHVTVQAKESIIYFFYRAMNFTLYSSTSARNKLKHIQQCLLQTEYSVF